MSKNMNMTQGKPLCLLVAFALPLMLGNVFQQLYTVVDTAIVGRGVGIEALAALGAVDWPNWMMVSIISGFTQGFSVRVSQKFGEGDIPGMKRALGQSALLSAVIAVIGLILMQAAVPLVMQYMRVPEEIRHMGALYMRILMAGIPAVFFFNYTSSVLRAVGDSKTPLIAMIAAALTNIVLDCLAVFALGWGIAGAAAATVAAQLLSGAICAVKMVRTPILHFGRDDLRPDLPRSGDLMRIGTPLAFKGIAVAVGGMIVQTIVNGFGTTFLAGFTATNKLYGLLEICAMAYGHAVTTYVGQNYGAGRIDRIKSGMRAAIILSLLTALVIAVPMFVFGRQFTMLFISSDVPGVAEAAGEIAYTYLCVLLIGLPMLYLLYDYVTALQGIGKSMLIMISGCIEFCVRVCFAIMTAVSGNEMLIYAAEITAWTGAVLFLACHYYRRMHIIEREAALKQVSAN